jgi:hypothetical protein
MYVVLEALRAGQHKNIYCGVLRVRKTRYYIKNYSSIGILHTMLKKNFFRRKSVFTGRNNKSKIGYCRSGTPSTHAISSRVLTVPYRCFRICVWRCGAFVVVFRVCSLQYVYYVECLYSVFGHESCNPEFVTAAS